VQFTVRDAKDQGYDFRINYTIAGTSVCADPMPVVEQRIVEAPKQVVTVVQPLAQDVKTIVNNAGDATRATIVASWDEPTLEVRTDITVNNARAVQAAKVVAVEPLAVDRVEGDINAYNVYTQKADGKRTKSRLENITDDATRKKYGIDRQLSAIYAMCPVGDQLTIFPPSDPTFDAFLPKKRNSADVRAIFGDGTKGWNITSEELSDYLTRTKQAYLKARLNVTGKKGRTDISSAADIIIIPAKDCAPTPLVSQVESEARGITVNTNVDARRINVDASRNAIRTEDLPRAAATDERVVNKPIFKGPGQYGPSYKQFTLGVGGGLLNMEGKDNFGRPVEPLSAQTRFLKAQFARYGSRSLGYVNFVHLRGNDGGLSGRVTYYDPFAKTITANTVAAGGIIKMLGSDKLGLAGGGQVEYTGVNTGIGRYEETSRDSSAKFSVSAGPMFGKPSRNFLYTGLQMTAQPNISKSDVIPGPYRANTSIELNPSIIAKGRFFFGNRVFTDIEGQYGITKGTFSTTQLDRITGRANNWNGSIGFGYDVYKTCTEDKCNAISFGIKIKHAGSQSTFTVGPTFLNSNSAEFNLNFTSGAKR
jgi:hypothetical protein